MRNMSEEYNDKNNADVRSTERTDTLAEKHAERQHENTNKLRDDATGNISRVDMPINAQKPDEKKLPWYKRTLFRKLRYGFIAILIALVLWGYVLMSENPVRIRKVDDVRLSFAGGTEADLKARNLIISGDVDKILPNVTVNVRTTLNDLPRFNNAVGEIVSASINLGDIREPGTYTRKISAVSTIGSVESVEPSSITITVENYVERQVPVSISFLNELPSGYWHDEPLIIDKTVKIAGPASIVSRVNKANCIIDLSERTSSINESLDVVLLDSNDEEVDPSGLVESIRAASIRMTVLPYVDLQLDQYISTIGELDENYEISSISINPAYLGIAAQQSVLNSILNNDSVGFEPINYSNFTTAGTYTQKVELLGLPSDITLLNDNNFIITVEVTEKVVTRGFTFRIKDSDLLNGDNNRYIYQFNTRSCYIEFEGPSRLIGSLVLEDISLTVDLSEYAVGRYDITPRLHVSGNPEWLNDGSVQIKIGTMKLVVTSAQ